MVFKVFLGRSRETFYKRLTLGILNVSPPDVWSDDITSKEFENSFFNSLIYHWSKEYNQSTSNKIAKVISYNLEGRNKDFDKNDINNDELKKEVKLKKEIEAWLYEYIDDDNNIFKKWDYNYE